jgi:hypothetical protein
MKEAALLQQQFDAAKIAWLSERTSLQREVALLRELNTEYKKQLAGVPEEPIDASGDPSPKRTRAKA